MPNGDLPEYIEKNPDVDRVRLVSFPFVAAFILSSPPPLGIRRCGGPCLPPLPRFDSRGNYESTGGDPNYASATVLTLTQTNILVDAAGRSRIADFGLKTSIARFGKVRVGPYECAYLPRWKAPELLIGEANTKATDVYSFAMVMVEVRGWWDLYCV